MSRWALVGLAVMIVTEAATLAGIEPFVPWNTRAGGPLSGTATGSHCNFRARAIK
jgi:hypothetical protein